MPTRFWDFSSIGKKSFGVHYRNAFCISWMVWISLSLVGIEFNCPEKAGTVTDLVAADEKDFRWSKAVPLLTRMLEEDEAALKEELGIQLAQTIELRSGFEKIAQQQGERLRLACGKDPEAFVASKQFGQFQKESALVYDREVEEMLDEILVPHQVRRLRQMALWNIINQSGGLGAVVSDKADRLELTLDDDQLENVRVLSGQFIADYKKLREKYRTKLFEKLPPAYSRILNDNLGEESNLNLPLIGF